jgi:hypothetical protein
VTSSLWQIEACLAVSSLALGNGRNVTTMVDAGIVRLLVFS